MGYQTTITFNNDAFGNIVDYPEQTVTNILAAMTEFRNPEGVNTYSIGNFCNPMVAQFPVHTSEMQIVVNFKGASFTFSTSGIQHTLSRNPEYLKDVVKLMKRQIRLVEAEIKTKGN